MTTPWTSFEIEQARNQFLFGSPIKIIARTLGRSPTAVNKVLSRYGIRTDSNASDQNRIQEIRARLPLPVEVNVRHMENFFKRRGASVKPCPDDAQSRIVGGERLTIGQMLLRINSLRQEAGLPVFLLSGNPHDNDTGACGS